MYRLYCMLEVRRDCGLSRKEMLTWGTAVGLKARTDNWDRVTSAFSTFVLCRFREHVVQVVTLRAGYWD